MRQVLKSIMLIAAAAMAFTSCQKEETAAPETVSATLTMHAGVEQTKTYLDENNAVLWGKGEVVTLYVGSGETAKFFKSASTDANDSKASASFTFDIKDVAEADSYALGGIYPASAAMDDNKDAKQYKVILPATQNQVDANYDPSAYIMVLKPEVVTELPTEYTASFRRATALNKITLTGVKENISSVEITVPEKKYLAGRRYVDLTTGESGEVYESGTQTNVVKVNGDFKSGTFDVWFCSWGVELVEGEALTVKMTSANNTYTRTITTRANGIKFVEGDLNTLTINMEKADVEAISTITGDYLIASKTSSGWFLMTPTNGSSYYTATGNVSSSSAVTCADFYDVADVENYVWKVAKYDNGYSIQSVYTNKYVAYSGSSNQAYANADLGDAAKMDIQLNGQAAVIESMNVSGRKLQYNASSPRFAFYSTAQTIVYLISWTPDATPRISLTENSDQVAFDATSYEFTYTTKNITGNVAAAINDGATMTNVSASASNGTVTVTFEANADTEQKTATIVLSYDGAVSQEFVLTQAGKPAAGTVVDVLTLGTTGINSGAGYSAWSGKTASSDAVYAGNTAGGNTSIQMRDNTNSGIVSTTSGGYAKKVVVTWNSNTANGRTLNIYGKNTAYTSSEDLHNATNQGTLLGTIKKETSTEFVIPGNYQYIGLRSASGAMYISEIQITWSSSPIALESIAVSGQKTEYYVGDSFVAPTVTATYSDGSSSVVSGTEFSGYDMSHEGEQTVTVSYTQGDVTKETTYIINVKAKPALASIVIDGTPKTEYTVGEPFVAPSVKATYSDNSSSLVSGAEFSGYNLETAGNQTVNVSYTENGITKSTSYGIVVKAAQGGDTKTISFKLDKNVTGSTSTSYVQNEATFTYDGIQYAVNNWNPNSLQIRGNQTSQNNMQSGKNFYLRNKTAIPGKITSIKVEYTSGSLVAASIYAVTSTSQITNQTTSASKKGTAATNAVTWDFDANGGYFAIGMQKGGTSGTAISGFITITYEAN